MDVRGAGLFEVLIYFSIISHLFLILGCLRFSIISLFEVLLFLPASVCIKFKVYRVYRQETLKYM